MWAHLLSHQIGPRGLLGVSLTYQGSQDLLGRSDLLWAVLQASRGLTILPAACFHPTPLLSLHSWPVKRLGLSMERAQQVFHNYPGQKWSLCSTLSCLATSFWNGQKPDPCKICPEGILWEQMTSKGKEGRFIASVRFLPVDFGRKGWSFCSASLQMKGYVAEVFILKLFGAIAM